MNTNQQTASAAFTALIIGVIVAVVVLLIAGPKVAGSVLLIALAVWALMMFGPSNPLTQMLQQQLGS